jgi:hypothetical protein
MSINNFEENCISDVLIPISDCLNREFSKDKIIKDKEIKIDVFYQTPNFTLIFFSCRSDSGFSLCDLLGLVYNKLRVLHYPSL